MIGEYLRPWKLATLGIGVSLLLAGVFYHRAPDWDVPISLIMVACAYLTALLSARIIVERRWREFPLMVFLTWFSVDGCYALYWHVVDPVALEAMRAANFPASLSLYAIWGFVWYPWCSLSELAVEARASFGD